MESHTSHGIGALLFALATRDRCGVSVCFFSAPVFFPPPLLRCHPHLWRLGPSGGGPARAVVYVAGGSAVMVAVRLSWALRWPRPQRTDRGCDVAA